MSIYPTYHSNQSEKKKVRNLFFFFFFLGSVTPRDGNVINREVHEAQRSPKKPYLGQKEKKKTSRSARSIKSRVV
jgi:hypothetical protein